MGRPRHWDPTGDRHGGTPTYPWRMAPRGLFTRHQLRERGLRPGGQDVAAQIMWRSRRSQTGVRVAYLYRLDRAKPVRPMTPAKAAALANANRARRTCPTCPTCGQDAGYVLPAHLDSCLTCADTMPAAA